MKKTVVLSFGRMNPMTNGHEKLADKIKSEASKRNADAKLYLSHSTNPKKDPLDFNTKVKFAKKAFGPMVQNSPARTIIEVAKELTGKYDNLVVVVGSDRIPEFKTLLNKYNGKDFTFKSIEIISAGERDPDAEGVTGMSGSKMRGFVSADDLTNFKKGVPSKLSDADAKALFVAVKRGMKLAEELELQNESVVSFQQRRQRAIRAKRMAKRLARARLMQSKRTAGTERLQQRAVKAAYKSIRRRVSGGRNYADLSTSEKIMVDTRLQKLKGVIKKLAVRFIPKVRAAEMLRKRQAMQKMATQNEDVNQLFSKVISEEIGRKETSRLDQLVRMGLADKALLQTIKRAVSKLETGDTLSQQERKSAFDLLQTLLDMVLSTDQLFALTRRQLQKENIDEASYPGNIGAMEMIKFFQKATPGQKTELKKLIADKKNKEAWAMVQNVTGVKLMGKQFHEEYEEDEDEDSVEIDGIQMAQVEIAGIIDDAEDIMEQLSEMEEEPEQWVLSKITKASDYISTVRDYIEFSDEDEYEEDEEDDEYEMDDDELDAELMGMEPEDFGEDYEEIKPIIEQVRSLNKKSEKSGIPYKTIKEVFNRGLESYTSHPSMTQEQWAFARVNSFIANGKTDKDLWEKISLNNKFKKFAESVELGDKNDTV